jgi:predicted transcriptional regulator
MKGVITMTKEGKIFVAGSLAFVAGMIALGQYNVDKERKLKEKKLQNEKEYFSKLSPEQVEELETQKIEVKKAEIELKMSEAELKKTVTQYEEQVKAEIEKKTMSSIKDDMRSTFDKWSNSFEDRIDKKVDRVISRIDDLSDKYGGVKQNSSQAPTISVVNAPNS